MQLTGRFIIHLLTSCPMAMAVGQDSWSVVLPNTGQNIRITDCVPRGDGYLTTNVHFWGSLGTNSEAHVSLLSPTGQLLETRQLWPSAASADVSVLLHDPVNARYHALGTLKSSSGQFWCFDYIFNGEGVPLDSNRLIFPNAEFAGVDNACIEQDGSVVIAAYGRTLGALAAEDRTIIYRISSNADSLTSRTLQGDFLFAARHVTILDGDTLLIACEGSPFNFVEEKATYYKLHGPALEVQGRFLAGPYDGSLDTVLSNAVVKAALHVHPLSSGRLIVSGSAASGQHAVIQKLDQQGRYLDHFLPYSEFDYNFPGRYGGSAMVGDDEVLFARMANFFIGPPSPFMPTFPNRIEYFKLDTALNLLCSGIVDGFADNAYYFLDRIKPTADGGFLLMGGRMDLNAPQPFFDGWIRKLPPTACYTGVADRSNENMVSVYPNPGTTSLMLTVAGFEHGPLTLRITEISGRSVRSETITNRTTSIDMSNMSSGLYLYSVVDADGLVLGSGKWIKY